MSNRSCRNSVGWFGTRVCRIAVVVLSLCSSSISALVTPQPSFLIIGGTGKIGTAVASHLLLRQPDARITLASRSADGTSSIAELRQIHADADISFQTINIDQRESQLANTNELVSVLQQFDCVIHTAGPYYKCSPVALQASLEAGVPVYVDVSDPLPYLQEGLRLDETARQSRTTALLAAGAFPGMSNVLGMETAQSVQSHQSSGHQLQDMRFNYFTAGLGGSGTINLYITNLGFGDEMGTFENGRLRLWKALSGRLLGTVDFFVPTMNHQEGNEQARKRVGTQQVFAWPFPEAATVAQHLTIQGSSSAAMGTAPDIWNSLLGLLVFLIPRSWWRNERFSQFLADFSEPLVWATDQWLRQTNPGSGETHAMRIDVSSTDGSTAMATIQAHDSFRQCVGQSCAEFALDCLEFPGPGVSLTEMRYQDATARRRIIDKLTSTPGTFCYTGPVNVSDGRQQPQPTKWEEAIQKAAKAETN